VSRIRVSGVAKKWLQDPAFRAEYDALEEEFALASAIVGARARAGLTQEQLARRMKTTQTVIARLESGRAKPSTRTLQRFARATGHRLVIGYEPAPAKGRGTATRFNSPPGRSRKRVG
jgi:ribosome-binding protein aMBF1 (putative translation factor)